MIFISPVEGVEEVKNLEKEEAKKLIENYYKKTVVLMEYDNATAFWKVMFADEPLRKVSEYWLQERGMINEEERRRNESE